MYALGPGEPATARLPLNFDESDGYTRSHGDYLEEGTFSCADGVIMGVPSDASNEWTGTLSDDAVMLVIGSEEFERSES